MNHQYHRRLVRDALSLMARSRRQTLKWLNRNSKGLKNKVAKKTMRSVGKITCPNCGFKINARIKVVQQVEKLWNFRQFWLPGHYQKAVEIKLINGKPFIQRYVPTEYKDYEKDNLLLACPDCDYVFDDVLKQEFLKAVKTLEFVNNALGS